MLKILVVDDEIKIREVVKAYCDALGYKCDMASDGLKAIRMLNNNYDCIVLDIMMPGLDGFETCKKIKEVDDNVGIIILSARTQEDDKLFLFNLGVDDYVTKPFSVKELMARIKAVCERHNKKSNEILNFNGLEINILGREVKIDKQKINLTPKEFDLLLYLIKNKGIALSREKILLAVWQYDYYDQDRTVDTHIKMLRNDLGKYRDYIQTIRGVGYKFEA